MPALALDWSHRLLRLMLKYRELAGGGELAGELVAFARRTRAVMTLLHDAARAGVLVVALDEPSCDSSIPFGRAGALAREPRAGYDLESGARNA